MAVVGLTVGFDADTKKFNKNIKTMDNSIRSTQGDVKALSKSLKFEWDSNKFVLAQKKAKEALQQSETKAQALRDRLKYLDEVGTDKTTLEYQKLQSQLVRTEAQAVEMRATLKELNELKLSQLSSQIEDVGAGITSAGQSMSALSAAAAALLALFAKIGSSAVSAGDDIGTTAQQLNLATDTLQMFRYIAQQTDVDITQMETGLKKIQGALSSLAVGEIDTTSQVLLDLGLSSEEAANGMEANIDTIINALANVKDETLQAYYANELFGERLGASMIPLLNDGGEGLATLAAEFENLGYLSDDTVQALDSFEDVMDRIKYQLTLVKNEVGAMLLPVMEKLASFVEEKVVPALQSFRDWFSTLSEQQIEFGIKVLAVVASIAPLLLIIGKVTSGVGSLIGSLGKLSSALTFLAAHPIIAIIMVVAGLLIYLYNTNEQFRESINNLVETIGNSLQPVLTALGNIFQTLIAVITPIMNMLGNSLAQSITILLEAITPLLNLMNLVLVPVLNIVTKVIQFIITLIGDKLTKTISFFVALFELEVKAIKLVINGIITGIENAINYVIDFLNSAIDKINTFSSILGYTIDKIDNVDLQSKITQDVTVDNATQADAGTVATEAISSASTSTIYNSTTTVVNDSSTKNITVELTVNNYGADLDYDEVVKEFDKRLLGAM